MPRRLVAVGLLLGLSLGLVGLALGLVAGLLDLVSGLARLALGVGLVAGREPGEADRCERCERRVARTSHEAGSYRPRIGVRHGETPIGRPGAGARGERALLHR